MVMGNDDAKLFVAGLPDSMAEDSLRNVFEATGGKVLNVSLPRDRTTGRPRGFGFVTMSSPAEAQAARDALDGSLQGGRSISVRPFSAEPPGARGPGGPNGPPSAGGPRSARPSDDDRKLYVGNLPYDCSQQDIEALVNTAAGDAGTVVNVSLPIGPDGRKKGFGFVVMSSQDAAKAAVAGLQTIMLRGRPLKVNMAQPKGDRPPRSEGFGGGGPSSYRGGAPGEFGGGGGGGPASTSSPFGPPSRKFDERRRKPGGGPGGGEDGPRKKRLGDTGRDRGGRGGEEDYSGGDDD
jgi:nucleolin